MPHLRSVSIKRGPAADERDGFPFTVPAVRTLRELDLDAPVTFFVGENGSGKSTLLEGIAAAAGLPTVGADDVGTDRTLGAQRKLAATLRLSWRQRVRRGFFMRAEDFFGFTRRLGQLRSELATRAAEVRREYEESGRSDYATRLALGPLQGSLHDMERRYGVDLDAQSHGQSFLQLFRARFVPGGLYLLDEPEAPLSPRSQLALLAMLGEMVAQDAQFVIATHSPILLAFPGARILDFDNPPVSPVAFEETEHFTITRDFLQAPDRYLRRLLTAETEATDRQDGGH